MRRLSINHFSKTTMAGEKPEQKYRARISVGIQGS